MKNLVVYYSRTGMTKNVAEYLAQSMECDIEEVVDLKDRRGAKGFVMGGKDAVTKALTEIGEPQKDTGAYDTVIIGTPVWASTMAPAIRTYIEKYKAKLQNVAFFCTEISSGGKNTFKDMEGLCGKRPKGVFETTEKEVKKETYKPKLDEFIEKIK